MPNPQRGVALLSEIFKDISNLSLLSGGSYFRDSTVLILIIILFPGTLINRHKEIFSRNPLFIGMRLPEAKQLEPIEKRFKINGLPLDFIKVRRFPLLDPRVHIRLVDLTLV